MINTQIPTHNSLIVEFCSIVITSFCYGFGFLIKIIGGGLNVSKKC